MAERRMCDVRGVRPAVTTLRRIAPGEPPRTEHLCEVHAAETRGGRRSPFGGGLFDDFVFRAFTKEQIADIARLLLERTKRHLHAQDIEVEFTGGAVESLAEEGFDPGFGACPLRRTHQRRVDNELSRMVLDGSLNPGDKVIVGAEEGKLAFEVVESAAAAVGGSREGTGELEPR